MGFQTIVHGHICLKGNFENSRHYIRSLGEDNQYPCIRAEMFSLGASESPYYYKNPIISFGASYKQVEHEWEFFILKFENILRNIEFETAKIQLETEILGTYNFFWMSKTGTDKFEEKEKLIETDEWYFGYGHRHRFGILEEPLTESHIYRLFYFNYPVGNFKKYDLYWKDIKIGILTETGWDMRSSGNITYTFDYMAEFPENVRLADSIKHSIKTYSYFEREDEENYLKMCEQEEAEYMDIVDSSDWRIVDSEGKSIKILCPIFLGNHRITWQKE